MSTFKLKTLAITAMLIDHIGAALIPVEAPLYYLFRSVGRIAFPIFAFLIVEGYCHTSNVKKYMARLAVFAALSEIPFNLFHSGKVFYLGAQNVFITLLAGLAAIHIIKKYRETKLHIAVLGSLLLIFALDYLRADCGSFGLIMILLYYALRSDRLTAAVAVGAFNIVLAGLSVFGAGDTSGGWDFTYAIQAFAAVSILPIYLYNGEKGLSAKYFFYLFYPAHQLIIYAVSRL